MFAQPLRPALVLSTLLLAPAMHAAESGSPAGPEWLDDYATAAQQADAQGKMLLVHFVDESAYTSASEGVEQRVATDDALRDQLGDWVLVRVPTDAKLADDSQRILDHGAFREMHRTAGVAAIDYRDPEAAYYGRVVSAFPFRTGKYYRWKSDYLSILVDLPAGTLTQRTMVWAVREHHERPQSTAGEFSPAIGDAARAHSNYQARVGVQGHQNWSSRSNRLLSRIGWGQTAEVVAESWPGQTMIDSCLDCVASWRHSSGHWGQVRRNHRLYGYDLKQGRNGIWYGTGIFAD